MEDAEKLKSLKTVATVVYALQALGFFNGITWIAAVVVDYVKKDDAAGWLRLAEQREVASGAGLFIHNELQ